MDDERDNLDVLGALLEEEYDVHLASSGHEALALIDSVGDFGVVVTDQRMPRMTGVELVTELVRRSPETVRIVLTAYSDVEPIVAAVNQGSVYRFLLKPWDPHEMRAAIGDALWFHRTRATLRGLIELLSDRKRELTATLGELAKAQAELMAAERMTTLGRVTSGIAHNIRNNLTVMVNVLNLVRQRPTDPEALRLAEAAYVGLEHVLRVVGDLGSFARAGAWTARRRVVETDSFLQQTLQLFRAEGAGPEPRLDVTVDGDARVLFVDPERVRQGILALLRNAARASTGDAPITIDVRSEGAGVAFEVRDGGIGMDAETLAQASTPFFSGFEPRGLGLGLEMVRMAADAHGGRLTLTSERGRGTTARLRLEGALRVPRDS